MGDYARSRLRAIAGLTALFALLFQALYAVPASERMAMGAIDAVLCHAKGTADTAGSPALPASSKVHCSLCIVAGFAALAAVVWLLVALGFRPEHPLVPSLVAPCPARLLRSQRSRAPPLPV